MYNQAKYGHVDVITGDYLAGELIKAPNQSMQRDDSD